MRKLTYLALLNILIIITTLCSCNKPIQDISFSVYYWKNNAYLTQKQKEILNTSSIKCIYLKICDFKWSESTKKIETPSISNIIESNKHIIPVFFIENKVFKMKNGKEFYEFFQQKIKDFEYLKDVKNIQIDCDWTIETQNNYFSFLKYLKQNGYLTEVTLRLHQIKHSKITGIPDVETGVLMIYNLTSPAIFNQKNSIYNYNLAHSYLNGHINKYPLKIKVALPAFSWGVHFQYEKIQRLISNTTLEDYNTEELQEIKPNLFKSNKPFYFKNIPINKRDIIRYEEPKIENISNMIDYLTKNIKQDSLEIIFFSLDSKFFNKKHDQYEKIISNYN
ncbi:MAG: hypothetical protein CMP56_04700 [Flavobacteriales bacterium]|nr:hypothetical protein [Flavobacteriales bacterium]|tara:strand:- start:466 stop:1470 length:1005 start_codon:yes stop_codon:yes gene_type:complete